MQSQQEIFKPHSYKQNLAIHSEKPIILLASGIQFGKSMAGALRMALAMFKHTSKDDNFLVVAPTYKILQQASLPAFLKVMGEFGQYSKVDAVFRMYNGGQCFFRTGTDPDSIVGITNVRAIWGDESGLFSLYFHENIQARAAFKQASIIYTTSPYSLNWIYSDYIRPIQRGISMPDVELIQARSDENPYFPKAEYERKRLTMDSRRFNMMFGGEFHKLEGLVYDCFDEQAHVIEPFELPAGTKFYAGVDWGYTNPTSILIVAVTPHNGIFVIHEYYKAQKTINEVAHAAEILKSRYPIERFYCDPASPANIQEFNKRSLTAVSADNDIRSGVDVVYEQFKSGRLKVFAGACPNLLDEISMYHYPTFEDIKPDKDVKDHLPVKQHDHANDALRYVMKGLHDSNHGNKRKPDVAGKSEIPRNTHHTNQNLFKANKSFDW